MSRCSACEQQWEVSSSISGPWGCDVGNITVHGYILQEWCKIIIRATAAAAKSLQLCPTLCDPIDGNPPGSPVPGILQARALEWPLVNHQLAQTQDVYNLHWPFKSFLTFSNAPEPTEI